MMNLFFEAESWEQAWQEHSEAAAAHRSRKGIDMTRSFDPKAQTFNEQSFSAEGRKRSARILNWLESRGVDFDGASVLDIGAASGVFSVPFAERGAQVTSVETSPPQAELLKANTAHFTENPVQVVSQPFERIDLNAQSWNRAFDFVFASMCPVVDNWASVEKILSCARDFCYISLPINYSEHSLAEEVWPLLNGNSFIPKPMEDMGYLLHLLYLKGCSYETLVTRETKTVELSTDEALLELREWLRAHGLPDDKWDRGIVEDYLQQTYPSGTVTVNQGGRFGKVLIRLKEQNMYVAE
ncbi:methyltransferase domain-containing protein [Saccharibacillus sp. CPCC 101409]|uniref:class I SAM-dependent methyltransferase n=1 Tax=Saccharibacillus sp. CPCC 101409 TaxID=3058041 RepID=UPI00267208B1|nr:methyltransferase domain-containing protein [Saccharibacillus sp. CPCC 101409]MDO3412467.1 methyltransferase domain-containing protein [Saccharibacillus sp. CPCC 101409]